MKIKGLLPSLIDDEAGVTAVEYALICSLVVIGLVSAMGALGNEIINLFSKVESDVVSAVAGLF